MDLALTWNGGAVARTVNSWARTLWGQPEFAGFDWPTASVDHHGLGSGQLGVGLPGPRLVDFAIRSDRTSVPTDVLDSQRGEWGNLNAEFSPILGEKKLEITTTPSGGGATTRFCYGRRERSFSWRRGLEAGAIGARPGGGILYPVQLVCKWPWIGQDRTAITGNHTGLSGTADAGEYKTGWRLVITAGSGQSAAPTISATIGGITFSLVWTQKTSWSGGAPGTSAISWDADDAVVCDFYYPHASSRLTMVSYIREEGSTTNLRDYGVLGMAVANMSAQPFIPAAGGAVSVTLTGMVSGSTCSLAYATLHEMP